MIHDVAIHAAFGALFAASGAYARQYCRHIRHQLIVGAVLVLSEAFVMVNTVG